MSVCIGTFVWISLIGFAIIKTKADPVYVNYDDNIYLNKGNTMVEKSL